MVVLELLGVQRRRGEDGFAAHSGAAHLPMAPSYLTTP